MNYSKTDWPVTIISGAFLLAFVLASLINKDAVGNLVNKYFGLSTEYFGAFWQVLLLLTFIVTIGLAVSRLGRVKLGKKDKPEISTFKWVAMILCTLLASGGVFWAASEPMYHFITTPPMFPEVEAGTTASIQYALSQSFLDWGFSAWAILGSLSAVVLMYAHYHKGMPLKPRTLLYPIFGKRIMEKSVLGTIVDVSCIIAVAAGTVGPIGFLGLQAAYGLNDIFGIPNTSLTQGILVVVIVIIASISAVTGINKGIQWLSKMNVWVTFILMGAILILGPAAFIFDSFLGTMGFYVQEFFYMSLYRGDQAWLAWWTVFFWGWFIGYGPMMAIFIARISRGRTIRELAIAMAIIAPLVTNFWFTVVGGSGIFFEINEPGVISNALAEGGMPAAVMSIVNQLPLGFLIAIGFLLVTILFVATTADSISYTMAAAVTGQSDPPAWLRVFWAVLVGALSLVLLNIGEDSVSSIQSFIVITAVPVSIILMPTLWLGPKVAKILAIEQGIISDGKVDKKDSKKKAS